MRRIRAATTIVLGFLVALLFSTLTRTQERRVHAEREIVNGQDVAAREVLVLFRRALQRNDLLQLRGYADADRLVPVGRGGLLRLRSRSLGASALLAFLGAHPDVARVE